MTSQVKYSKEFKTSFMECVAHSPPKTKVKTILGLTQLHPRSQRQKR